MQITYIETSSITNEVLRAYAGAHRLCIGYPDGVPETWRDVAPVKQGGGLMPDLPTKHFTDETLEACPACRWRRLDPAAEPVDWPERDGAGDDEC